MTLFYTGVFLQAQSYCDLRCVNPLKWVASATAATKNRWTPPATSTQCPISTVPIMQCIMEEYKVPTILKRLYMIIPLVTNASSMQLGIFYRKICTKPFWNIILSNNLQPIVICSASLSYHGLGTYRVYRPTKCDTRLNDDDSVGSKTRRGGLFLFSPAVCLINQFGKVALATARTTIWCHKS